MSAYGSQIFTSVECEDARRMLGAGSRVKEQGQMRISCCS